MQSIAVNIAKVFASFDSLIKEIVWRYEGGGERDRERVITIIFNFQLSCSSMYSSAISAYFTYISLQYIESGSFTANYVVA